MKIAALAAAALGLEFQIPTPYHLPPAGGTVVSQEQATVLRACTRDARSGDITVYLEENHPTLPRRVAFSFVVLRDGEPWVVDGDRVIYVCLLPPKAAPPASSAALLEPAEHLYLVDPHQNPRLDACR